MPHAIADSDDDGDDNDIFIDEQDGARREGVVSGSNEMDGEGALQSCDGTNERSTGSTERLKRQMLSAERKLLLTNSAPEATTTVQQSSGSPSTQANKRRHTTVFGSEPLASPEKAIKRTKTLKTYGGRRHTQAVNDATLEHSRNDDGGVMNPATSQSARFTEHSGINSSAELPAGSIQAEFMNHEPAMFRDSGSTVADTSSVRQRLLEQALGTKRALNPAAVDAPSADEQKSSSFPWSASAQTRSTKSTGKSANAALPDASAEDANADGISYTEAKVPSETSGSSAPKQSGQADDHALSSQGLKKLSHSANIMDQLDSPSNNQPSPAVEIPPVPTGAPANTQRSNRGRKRKSDEPNTTDPLNSDDKAIGLPKERYQPRPSRRRATAVVEEPIDFSVRPERAAKVKRAKTTNADTSLNNTRASQDNATIDVADVNGADTGRAAKRTNGQTTQDVETLGTKIDSESSKESSPKVLNEQGQETAKASSQRADSVPPPPELKSDDHIFVKPAMPTPKPKSSSKAKRSHTTIFEDHIEFTSSQRLPSLRQQQATRKSALQDVQNDAARPPQRKRRTVVVDEDDDDVDELAKDTDDDLPAEEDTAPKKRGEGRPQKSKAKTKAKSAEKVKEVSDDDDDEPSEEDAAPKKRGRGRPAKAATTAESKSTGNDIANGQAKIAEHEQRTNEPSAASTEATGNSNEDIAATPKASLSAKDRPTPSPSPDTGEEKAAATPQKAAKPNPTQHSPIKAISGSSMARYRVGLNKRQRIPSLLRTFNPPKK